MSYTNPEFHIIHQSDRLIIDGLVRGIREADLEITRGVLHLAFGPQIPFASTDDLKSDPVLADVLSQNSVVTQSITLVTTISGVDLAVYVRRVPGDATDVLVINASTLQSNGGVSQERTIALTRLISALKTALKAVDLKSSYAKAFGAEAKQLLESREAALLRVEDLGARIVEQIGEEAATVRARLEAEYVNRERELRSLLEQERLAFQQEKDEISRAFERREQGLAQRAEEMDMLEARAARRRDRQDLARRITENLQKFTLTDDTTRKRLPIHIISICLLLLLTGFTIYNMFTLSSALVERTESQLLWAQGVRSLLGGVALASTAVFYVRWTNHWFERHANAEFRLKRMALDVDRANWVVEMALEWKDEKGTEAPGILVDRLTADLFEDEAKSGGVVHPSEQLASAIFGAATELRIPLPSGGFLRYDRKGVQRLDEPVTDGE